MRATLLALLLALPAVALVGCFDYDEPTCSFLCGATGGDDACPDDYECRADGYCHKQGTTDVCPFSDAALVNDLSAAAGDMTDLSNTDATTD